MKSDRTHLAPTAVTNKNGVQTTVHKKPVSGTTGDAQLPKAALPTAREARELLEYEAVSALINQDYGPPTTEQEHSSFNNDYPLLKPVIAAYGDETLQKLIEHSTTRIGTELEILIRNLHPDEESLNDWITIKATTKYHGIELEHLINGLEDYPQLDPMQDGHYPTRRAETLTAITLVSAHFGRNRKGLTYGLSKDDEPKQSIEDKSLRTLLTTHENPAAIADIIISRSLTEPDQITALYETMRQTENAINAGSL